MAETQQISKNAITLKGSATLVAEYLNFGINSILYQRGIYPSDSFTSAQHFGLTILMSTDDKIIAFLKNVLDQTQEWLVAKKVQKMSMVISSVATKEVLERWDFNVDYSGGGDDANGNKDPEVGNKDLKLIQKEIRDVLRQICATITFLPLLDDVCSFDVQIYTTPDCEVPTQWDETEPCFIANSQQVQLKSFSTSLHKMQTVVSYKTSED